MTKSKQMKKFLVLIMIVCAAQIVHAQQFPIYSNYLFNKVLYNPAVAGASGLTAFQASYRSQWVKLDGAPRTFLLSGDTKLNSIPLGVGGFIMSDIAGPINYTGFSGQITYHLSIGEKSTLSAGLSMGMYRLFLNNDFNAQTMIDNTIIQAQQGKIIPDAGIGLYYYNQNGLYAGFSIPQTFQTKAKFDGTNESAYQLERVFTLLIGKTIPLNDFLKIEPSILLKTAKPSLYQADISARMHFYDRFWIGASYRTDDAISFLAGLRINEQFMTGYAYDATVSNLNRYSNGTHEVILSYTLTKPSDRDGDGVIDKKDDCPDIPGPKSNNGCPEVKKDTDHDGVMDEDDECPNTAGEIDNKGCPVVKKEEKQVIDFAIENLEFEWDKAVILASSFSYLDNLAALLVEKKDWKIHLAGHTDNSGEEKYNFILSKKRAFAVQKYLVQHGVDKDRIIVEYFGEYMPIDTNDTPEGRQKNRRVEMDFVFD
jgi:type IX secretion system PorP/SprF family membrane protein